MVNLPKCCVCVSIPFTFISYFDEKYIFLDILGIFEAAYTYFSRTAAEGMSFSE